MFMYVQAFQQGVYVLLDGVEGDLIASNGIEKLLAYLMRREYWRDFLRKCAVGCNPWRWRVQGHQWQAATLATWLDRQN